MGHITIGSEIGLKVSDVKKDIHIHERNSLTIDKNIVPMR